MTVFCLQLRSTVESLKRENTAKELELKAREMKAEQLQVRMNKELSRGEICVANLKAPCEWCEFGQVFKWAICENGLLPNGPKWVDSEFFFKF